MNVSQRARLEALEAAIAGDRSTAEIALKPSHLLSDAECVQAVYDLCHAHPPSMRIEDLRLDDPEIEATVAEARRLIAEGYGR